MQDWTPEGRSIAALMLALQADNILKILEKFYGLHLQKSSCSRVGQT